MPNVPTSVQAGGTVGLTVSLNTSTTHPPYTVYFVSGDPARITVPASQQQQLDSAGGVYYPLTVGAAD